MIRKFIRHLLLRCLILAFTGNQVASVTEETRAPEKPAPSAAVAAVQALDRLGATPNLILLPVAAYEVIQGAGYR